MDVVMLYCLVFSVLIVAPIVEGTCNAVPIEEWGGSPLELVDNLPRQVELLVVTHTDTAECDTDEDCEEIANAIRNTQKEQGLADIGLSFLVGGNGKIYEGAGWKVGSHTRGFSERSISLSFIGNFTDILPTDAALEATNRFLGCLVHKEFIGCEYSMVGQRQLESTTSPGDALQNIIQSWPRWSLFVLTRPH